MTTITARCEIDSSDVITASISGERVELEPNTTSEIYLAPDKARTFARGILALADEIDGGEAEGAPVKRALKVGDRVRILRNAEDWEGSENVGSVGTLRRIDADSQPYLVELDAFEWWCAEVELFDEPEPALADWERDLLEGSAPCRSSRAKYVEEAKALLGDTFFEAESLTRLAEFLAAGE